MYKLLIVEDEQLEREAIRFIVEKHCPEITVAGEAGDGESAVSCAEQQSPDIVVMDIRIPEMNGLETTRRIKNFLPECKIVILSAFDEFSYARQAISLGATEYLLKPARPQELVKVLAQVVGQLEQMKRKRREESHLREYFDGAKPYIQMSFVYDLIGGCIEDQALLRQRAAFLGLEADPGVAVVAAIDSVNRLTRQDKDPQRHAAGQKLYRDICGVLGKSGMATPFSGDKMIILLGSDAGLPPEQMKAAVRALAETVHAMIAQATGVAATIGIGRHYDDSREVYKSYMEAVSACQRGFFPEDDPVHFFDELAEDGDGTFAYPFRDERAVLEKVRCGDRRAAKDSLNALLEKVFQAQAGIETVKACALELLIVLSRAAVEGGANLEKLTLQNFALINKLVECTNQSQLYHLLMNSLDRFLDDMIDNRTSVNSRMINQACNYILSHCHRNLTLEEVAQTAHLSAFYFSRVFKQEKGCNFVEFLTRARVERAKKLLSSTDLSVVRIALESGYQDASYFCRVFRQEAGLTPNQYRNRKGRGQAPATTDG
ncbi:MAG TPA: response regulator [Selenomonadales bacterium]|nr:response regulator [Selenomonadales bacterium]